MSSEMRALELLRDEIFGAGNNYPAELQKAIVTIREALLARTEAGADGAVAWMHESDPTRVVSAETKATAIRDGGASASAMAPYSLPLTHPQDASGDAECAYCGDHPDAGRDHKCDAMHAKEAK